MNTNQRRLVVELLTSAKALIQDPKHWIQGAACQDKQGFAVSTQERSAFCFCSIGALERAYLGSVDTALKDAIASQDTNSEIINAARELLNDAASVVIKVKSIVIFNDSHDHEAVMRVWDKAIVTAKSAVEASEDWLAQEVQAHG